MHMHKLFNSPNMPINDVKIMYKSWVSYEFFVGHVYALKICISFSCFYCKLVTQQITF